LIPAHRLSPLDSAACTILGSLMINSFSSF
jgi:hypothetical protein